MANGEGIPLYGDRSAQDTINFPDLHAKDIRDGTPTVHNPAPGAAGDVVKSDGTKWISGSAAGLDTTAIHDNVADEIEPIAAETSLDPTDVLIFEKASDGFTKRSIEAQHLLVGGSGHVIEDNGTPMAARANLDFVGFTVADDLPNNATVVTMLTETMEDLTAQIPAVGDHYDLAQAVVGTDLKVYKNGLRQEPASITIDVDGLGFTTSFTCISGDKLVVDYNIAAVPIREEVITFTYSGLVEAISPTVRFYNITSRNRIISKVFVSVNSVSTSGSIICNVFVDGTSIFTIAGHKPTITVGNNTGYTTSIDNQAWNVNSYLQASIESSGANAYELVIHVVYS